MCILYLFDPEKSKQALKQLCCCFRLFRCCRRPCSDCCVRYEYPSDYENNKVKRKSKPRQIEYDPPSANPSLKSSFQGSIGNISLAASAPPVPLPEENDALLARSAARRQSTMAKSTESINYIASARQPTERAERTPKHSYKVTQG